MTKSGASESSSDPDADRPLVPELPEVETTRRELEIPLVGRRIRRVLVREPRLRWPIPADFPSRLEGRIIEGVGRRAKYLIANLDQGAVLVHLGMAGSLRMVAGGEAPGPHDHVDWELEDERRLRYRDPRRFGAMLWHDGCVAEHPLLAHLGPEPLSSTFHGDWLFERSRGRRAAIKSFLMDGRIVAGVGNIYAAEALFEAGIHPARAAGRVSRARYAVLAAALRRILGRSIGAGGTTFRDYARVDGQPGRYRTRLTVYDRAGEPCLRCGTTLRGRIIGQRATVWCPACQR